DVGRWKPNRGWPWLDQHCVGAGGQWLARGDAGSGSGFPGRKQLTEVLGNLLCRGRVLADVGGDQAVEQVGIDGVELNRERPACAEVERALELDDNLLGSDEQAMRRFILLALQVLAGAADEGDGALVEHDHQLAGASRLSLHLLVLLV